MKIKNRLIAFALAAVMVVSAVAVAPTTVYAEGTLSSISNSDDQTIYSLVNNYYKIKSVYNGKYLLGNNAGYEAQAKTFADGMTFFFKASDLGQYILYDSDSKYLTYNKFNAIVRNKSLSSKVRFDVQQYDDGSFTLYSYTYNKYVGIKGTSLVWRSSVDNTCYFLFEETTGNNPYPEASTNVTFYDENGNEVPETEAVATSNIDDDVVGFADTHAHLFHNLGSGEVVFAGESFDPLGITEALSDCTDVHGVNGAYDIWGKAVDSTGATHNTYGYPTFGYWPTAYSTNHIQTYYKWVERTYLAGERVMVQQAVNNEILGDVTNALPPYANSDTSDMGALWRELDATYELQDYIDAQCGGPGEGWFRICTNSTQAREVISQGKMAVFLSIEEDNVLDATEDYIGQYEAGEITEDEMNAGLAEIESKLDQAYAKGVRSFFMIHALNNGFGGCQLYQGEIFSIMNYLKTADFYQPEVSTNPRVFYKQPKADLPDDAQGHANVEGLTKTGEWMVYEMISRHMIIDVDHMSDKSFNAVLDILWEEKYPGIIASHTRILDMFDPEDEAWEQMDIPRMIKIFQLGGFISVMLWETMNKHQKCVSDYLEFMINLSNSSSTATSAFLYNEEYQKYGGPYEVPTTWYNQNDDPDDDLILGVGWASDVNGACMLPNFDGVEGVYDELDYDNFGILDSRVLADGVTAKFDRQTTGNYTFDINGDRGCAHYGLIPDMLARFASRPDRYNLSATFNSAEAYLRMLERAENYSGTYPSRDPSVWLTVSTEYWHDTTAADDTEEAAEETVEEAAEETVVDDTAVTEDVTDTTEDTQEQTIDQELTNLTAEDVNAL